MFDHEAPSFRASLRTWLLAGLGAVALHAGGAALALGYLPTDESDQELGAPAIEIGVELSAPRLDPTDQPVGPDTAALTPAPTVAAQQAVVDPSELPKAVPTETDDPERVVSPANTKKPEQNDPKTPTAQAASSQGSMAVEATATPTLQNAVASTRSLAPALGTGDSVRLERVTWEKELIARFNKFKRYPSDRTTESAQLIVGFELDRAGNVLSSQIVKGSGDSSFDAAALAMVQRANPVPPPPPLVADQGLSFSLPVIFYVEPHG